MKYELTAKRLRHALAKAHMQPQELAEKSRVTIASINQYINGSQAPSNIIVGIKMGEVLNVNPQWLMGYDLPMKPIAHIPEELPDIDTRLQKITDCYNRMSESGRDSLAAHAEHLLIKFPKNPPNGGAK